MYIAFAPVLPCSCLTRTVELPHAHVQVAGRRLTIARVFHGSMQVVAQQFLHLVLQ